MSKIQAYYEDQKELSICNDCSTSIGNIPVVSKGFPEIIVCDSCVNKYYVEKPNVKTRYR